ncbi:alcohol oxidase [Annulohypoxylon truncatum]|uniref:alcohol oxidase n=1 Tax=Annulohypoxylon truncatum TaxID=327061 RepID=UPI0020073AB8|nr:alcohol oxidase [Annulohypoxylon truncatum]KAI1207436.1 alcohol oxidase [Annulohypoxylon truncatum]
MWPFTESCSRKSFFANSFLEYDYIIIGGGTAGCAVASRLSEDETCTVLLIEKGPAQDSWASKVPLISSAIDEDPRAGIIHRYTEPADSSDGIAHRLVNSESLGGNSKINGMLYTRGVPEIYENWARIGHANWSWSHVEPYFRRIEEVQGLPKATHAGRSGPIHIVRHPPMFEAYDHAQKAAAKLGLPLGEDANDPLSVAHGYFPLDYTIDAQGYRHSAHRAYLPGRLVSRRSDRLTIRTGVIATRLALDVKEHRANGVYIQSHKCQQAAEDESELLIKARREVILCGGAIGSPQLLQLSGVGPELLLKKHDIQVKRHLRGVGAGLSDHHAIPICIEIPPRGTLYYLEKNPIFLLWHLLLYLTMGLGWMKSPPTNAAIFLNTSNLDLDTMETHPQYDTDHPCPNRSGKGTEPDVEIMLYPASGVQERCENKSLFTLYTCLLRPESSGSIQIKSLDPRADPSLRLGMLSSPKDIEVARKALRFSLKLAESFIQSYPHPARLFVAPNAETGRDWKDLSDDELDKFVQDNIKLVYHLSSSCHMANEEDGGVVDDELRVHGFENLRIADASIFPTIPATHTMAPTYMVAERCADFIKATWYEGSSV